MTDILLSSNSEHWCTPEDFLERVRQVNSIYLDPCSNVFSTVRAKKKVTPPQDGLTVPWTCDPVNDGLVYVNPPYGKALPKWVKKAAHEALENDCEIIMLTPSRTDTRWFHDGILSSADALCFVKGRLKFIDGVTGLKSNPATFPSLVTYWGRNIDLFETVFRDLGMVIKL